MAFLSALPLIEYLVIFMALRARKIDAGTAAIYAACYWGCLLLALTELASFAGHIDRDSLAAGWLLAIIVTTAVARRRMPATVREAAHGAGPWQMFMRLRNADRALLLAIMLLIAAVGITAIVSPPNTWDVVDYHLSRVVFWISNRGVQFFPTLDYAQTINSPWAEYAMLHLYVLFGSDRLVNLVEWGSFLGSALCSSLIARELGAGARGQVLAATAGATIPSAILEGSGAMNTSVVAFWIAACVYALLRFSKEGSWCALSGGAMACGLAILTKGTAYVLLPPMIAACWWMGSPACRRRFIVGLPVFALIVLGLNGPHLYRTFELTGSPLGHGEGLLEGGQALDLKVGRLSLGGTVANVVRNLSLDVTVTGAMDDYAARAASRVIRLLGQDPDDPDFIWHTPPEVPAGGFRTNPPNRHEAFAGSPLHLLLIALAASLSLVSIRSARRRTALFALGLIGAFLLFSALVRWQIWGARYQLPLLVLGAALIGAELPRYLGRWGTTAIATVLILAAIPNVLSNDLRPLAFAHLSPSRLAAEPFAGSIWSRSRANLYFADQHQDLEDSYMAAGAAIRRNSCNAIGIDDSLEHYEYPLLAQLDLGRSSRHIHYVGVYNASARFGRGKPAPCLVVCFACAHIPHKWSEYASVGHRVSLYGDVALFSSEGDIRNTANDSAIDGSQINLISTIAQMRQDMLALKREASWPRYDVYSDSLRRTPVLELSANKRFFAIERTLYDGSRVWELTGTLRTKAVAAGSSGVDLRPLLAGEEALRNFVSAGNRAMSDFASYAANARLNESP